VNFFFDLIAPYGCLLSCGDGGTKEGGRVCLHAQEEQAGLPCCRQPSRTRACHGELGVAAPTRTRHTAADPCCNAAAGYHEHHLLYTRAPPHHASVDHDVVVASAADPPQDGDRRTPCLSSRRCLATTTPIGQQRYPDSCVFSWLHMHLSFLVLCIQLAAWCLIFTQPCMWRTQSCMLSGQNEDKTTNPKHVEVLANTEK
jgi:hypothetical protein